MKSLKIIAMLFMVLYLPSCDRLDGIDEGDRNTYTWKGRLVQDCNEAPAKHVDLRLEVRSAGVPDDTYEVIAEGATDDDGYFTLTYRKIRRLSATDVSLILEDGSFSADILLNAPVNQDVYRDISVAPCHQLYFVINNRGKWDSLYLAIGKIYERESLKTMRFSIEDQTTKPITMLELSGQSDNMSFKVESFLDQTWNHTRQDYNLSAAPSWEEMWKSVFSYKIDSIPEDYLSHDYSIRGYPKVDTVRLTLE